MKPCTGCGAPRPLAVRCSQCGDRLVDSSELSPYERLGLTPRPLYHEREVRAAEERLLDTFHILTTSRHLARWALKQRALICRDASLLCSLSGALGCYLKEVILSSDLIADNSEVAFSSLRWSTPLMKSLDLLRAALPDESQAEGKTTTSHHSPALERHLLDTAYLELSEYDGYQERERLFNRSTRELIVRAREVAHALSGETNLIMSARLATEIQGLSDLELWLDARRASSAISLSSL